HEWERALAADTMIRTTMAVTNGTVVAKFLYSASTPTEDVPRDLLLGANHDGEWAELLRMPETGAVVYSGASPSVPVATLSGLEPVSVERTNAAGTMVVTTTWTGIREGAPLTWVRTVTVQEGGNEIDLVDEVTGDVPVNGI